MAVSMASINPKGLSNFRRWMTQYQATYGMAPPSHLTSSYLQGEIDANIARQGQFNGLELQKESMENQKNQWEQDYDQRSMVDARNYQMELEDRKKAEKAAMWSGIGQVASIGLKAVDTFDLGKPIADVAGSAVGSVWESISHWFK